MTGAAFSLIPFPGSHLPDITITGTISRLENRIALGYSLAGTIEDLVLAPLSRQPRRKDGLWQTTCFEMFLAIKDQPRYWEFNFSPSGDWNSYRMDAYRRLGFDEERSISGLTVEAKTSAGAFRLTTHVDLSLLASDSEALQIGLSAVIQAREGNETYWALTHPGPQPDFHLRESFVLELAGRIQPSTRPRPAD
jgi:hypothetical protein